MRIVQLVDSLNTGGAEKMAINFANSLNSKIDFSGLITTRLEGNLKTSILAIENYLFLNKTKIIDFKAIQKLKKYCKQNKIDIIHAHGTSFFTACLLKIVHFKIKIIYHEHTGFRSSQSLFENKLLWFCSFFFGGIIVVNQDLNLWYKNKIGFKNCLYLPNFVLQKKNDDIVTKLAGNNGKRILYLANLRNPKNHLMVLEIAIQTIIKYPDWSFHLVGTDFNDAYSSRIKAAIDKYNLFQNVYIYGLKNDVTNIIEQSEICIITSKSEGLPVSFLEYASNKKPVVSTNVGEISKFIKNGSNGFLVPSKDTNSFVNALSILIESAIIRKQFGDALYANIKDNCSEDAIISKYLLWIKTNL